MAKFIKGQSGNPGGMPKGIKHKPAYNVRAILEEIKIKKKDGTLLEGFNPFMQLAELAVNAKSEKVRCDASAELAGYCAAKLKSVELTTDSEKPFSVIMQFGNPADKK